jgi:hypothetical protein
MYSRQGYPQGLHRDAVTPDGIPVVVEWDRLGVGTSVFIPAVNLAKLAAQVRDIAGRRKMIVKGFPRIEAGKYGMRFWRMV